MICIQNQATTLASSFQNEGNEEKELACIHTMELTEGDTIPKSVKRPLKTFKYSDLWTYVTSWDKISPLSQLFIYLVKYTRF